MFFSIYSSFGARLLLFIVGGLITSSDNPLDFHDEICFYYYYFFKNICSLAGILNNFLQENLWL